MITPRVSAIVPVYNGEKYIRESLSSVLAQTFSNLELIVVDDGSSDSSEQIVKEFLGDHRVRYIRQENRGVAGARNAGIRASKGDLIAFLDQDDIWLPSKIAMQVRYLDWHPEVALVHTNMRMVDATGQPLHMDEARWDNDARLASGFCFPKLLERNRLAVLTVCARRSALDEIGLFREDIAGVDDYECWLRLSLRHSFGHIAEPLALYRLHGSNESAINWLPQLLKTLRAIEDFFRNHPVAIDPINSKIYRQRIVELASLIATELSLRNQYKEARPYILRVLRYGLISRAMVYELLAGFVPLRFRVALRWYIHRIGGLLKRRSAAAR